MAVYVCKIQNKTYKSLMDAYVMDKKAFLFFRREKGNDLENVIRDQYFRTLH